MIFTKDGRRYRYVSGLGVQMQYYSWIWGCDLWTFIWLQNEDEAPAL